MPDMVFGARGRSARTSRRRFLQFSAAAVSTVALSNCARNLGEAPAEQPSQSANILDDSVLHIYTWADYSNTDLYQRFTEKTGIQVVSDVYDSNETMLAKLQAGGGNQYSIIYPSDYMVRQMIDAQLLLKLDRSKLVGLDNLMDRWQNPPYDPNSAHSLPFNWGTTGLIYNTEVLKTTPEDWDFLWENQPELAGKMTLLDDVRETLGMVLKSLGYSYNATDPTQIEAAAQQLLTLKPALSGFQTYGWEDQLIAGDLSICMTYSTLGNLLPLDNPQLVYVIPQSGTSIWTDTMAVPAKAPNVAAAYAWMNFILDPDNSAFAATQLKLGTPNQAAFGKLPTEIQAKKTLYPTAAMIAKGEGITPVGEAQTLYDTLWTEIKSA
ncbi:MAG: spermidine/putrescine ABC transporter substrate-binding protein [Elainella sp. Prado103]|jgi:spermidine/putrescine transport system substrate-binding protein|nr:spermidine/putrescine ABC transporter substrate-binding protein [Elainella sp. Prado103]